MLDMGAEDFKMDVGRKEEKLMNNDKEVSLSPFLKSYPQLFADIASKI